MRPLLAAAALALAALGPAQAQTSWPAKPVRFINSFPPGGPSDLLARAVADVLQARFKQPFVVENKAGASGNIGADAVAKAAPDGGTVLFGIDSTVTVNPHIYKAMPFKPADLRPLLVMASSGLLVGAHPGTGFRSLADLVAAGKAKGVTFSSAGSGSPGHLAAEMFTEATGMKITHVPYKGNTPAVTAVLAGEVDGGVLATPGMLPHVKAGKITPLAVTSRTRSPLAPEVPTVAQAGLPQLEQEVLYVVMVPAATPEPVAQAVQAAIAEAIARPDLRGKLEALDMRHEGLAGAAAAQRLAELSGRYGKVIRATGMKVE
ncbi:MULTISPECIES: Bug family tripartite tricarboxylate transporter substrate binding protein [Ramlibacter]|uniref:Tripartite tricarboxylate transporter substrate binding protein n=1 Tax=Ramlibacter pinisoli TaxID=2682844 RepID=A0A6N8IRV5_9BURK|nr:MULTISPECIES: tripartite tricarboxylate transporter substrate binding protein [Ramlibacter]MBA2964612.1 tripartite tricarboxylate transporter substrate binding protein [Ramlibacter sp. CGMCC 1.13660]MVQ29577.1 tripartite tricarboxylate transporter substrate binding protein [Ramlibacter pinisoli]